MSCIVFLDVLIMKVFSSECESSHDISDDIRNISSCTYSGVSYSGNGGVFSVQNGGTLNMTGCTFIDCKATDYRGGAICCYLTSSSTTSKGLFRESEFIRCSSYYGGAIFWSSYGSFSLDLMECSIDSCTASSEGGGLDLETNSNGNSNITILECNITGCTSSYGGGLYCYTYDYGNSNITILECNITGCNASYDGGGLRCYNYVNGNSDITILECNIIGCEASRYGGGLYCYNYGNSDITRLECNITGCTSSYGGGLWCYNNGNSNITILECNSTGCTSSNGGGLLCGTGTNGISNVTILECNIPGGRMTFEGNNMKVWQLLVNGGKAEGAEGSQVEFTSINITDGGEVSAGESGSLTFDSNVTMSGSSKISAGNGELFFNKDTVITFSNSGSDSSFPSIDLGSSYGGSVPKSLTLRSVSSSHVNHVIVSGGEDWNCSDWQRIIKFKDSEDLTTKCETSNNSLLRDSVQNLKIVQESDNNNGLSSGAVAGIIVACVVVVAIVVVLIVYFAVIKKNKDDEDESSDVEAL